jgi:prevent-host-death family protein
MVSVVNMLEAKSNLSRLVDAVESGAEREIVIARNGRPAAKLVPISSTARGKRIGVAKDKWVIPETIDADNPLIEKLFAGETK